VDAMQALEVAYFLEVGEMNSEDWREWVICRLTDLHLHQGFVLEW
jgi:hypothetical protein